MSLVDTITNTQELTTAPGLAENNAIVVPAGRQEDVNKVVATLQSRNVMTLITITESASKDISQFSDKIFENTKLSDTGEIGGYLSAIKNNLKVLDPKIIESKPGFLSRMIGKTKEGIERYREQYTTVKAEFDKIESNMRKDIDNVKANYENNDKLAHLNLQKISDLEVILVALQQHYVEIEAEGQRLKALADAGRVEDVQKYKEFESYQINLEKQISNTAKTRFSCMQFAITITQLKDADLQTINTGYSLISGGIGEWKKQTLAYINAYNTKKVSENQNNVFDLTNDMARKTADIMKTAVIESTKNAQRDIYNIETLEYTNKVLAEVVSSVEAINSEGRAKRRDDLAKLAGFEQDLRKTLLGK